MKTSIKNISFSDIVIERNISDDEILVRYVFSDDFKRKVIIEEKIISKELLGPMRGGTSLQREKYVDEQKCIELGESVPNKKLVGFLLFKKKKFNEVKKTFVEEAIISNQNILLDAYIKATPLGLDFKEIDFNKVKVLTKTKGYPAHADIIYLNPKVINEENNV